MEYRKLGSAGIRVSEIGLGSWLTYGCGVGDETARACIHRAFELGINFFDTADVYHRGDAERTLGKALSDFRRQDVVVGTKCFFPMSDNANDRGLSRKHIFEATHAALKRLDVDYIDIMQCHRFDIQTPLEETIRAYDDLIRQGKILYWGTSEWTADQLRFAIEKSRQMGACPPASEQPEYSLAARRVETNGVQNACDELGIGMVLWSPLKQGVLSGKYSGGKMPKDSRAASKDMNGFWGKMHEDQRLIQAVDAMLPIAKRNNMTPAQLALTWLRTRRAVASIIIGASRIEQVDENAAATEFSLSPDDLGELDRLFPAAEFK